VSTKYLADSEVLTVAMNIEDAGYKFYDKAAGAAKRPDTKMVFERLRDEELEHYNTFKLLLADISKAEKEDYFSISEDISAYLDALIATGVFSDVDPSSIVRISEVRALEIGIEAERDSILFYTAAEKSSVNPKARKVMRRLIDIEKEHMVTLTKRLRVARKLF
jgi:rubrerythrin